MSVETLARISVREPRGPAVVEPTTHANHEMVDDILARAEVVDRRGAPIPRNAGETYIRALPQSLRGSRLWAEEVDEPES